MAQMANQDPESIMFNWSAPSRTAGAGGETTARTRRRWASWTAPASDTRTTFLFPCFTVHRCGPGDIDQPCEEKRLLCCCYSGCWGHKDVMGTKAHNTTKALFTHTNNPFALIRHACPPPFMHTHTHSYICRGGQTPASPCLPHMSHPYLWGSKVGMKRCEDAMRDLETYRLLLYPSPPLHTHRTCLSSSCLCCLPVKWLSIVLLHSSQVTMETEGKKLIWPQLWVFTTCVCVWVMQSEFCSIFNDQKCENTSPRWCCGMCVCVCAWAERWVGFVSLLQETNTGFFFLCFVFLPSFHSVSLLWYDAKWCTGTLKLRLHCFSILSVCQKCVRSWRRVLPRTRRWILKNENISLMKHRNMKTREIKNKHTISTNQKLCWLRLSPHSRGIHDSRQQKAT